MKLYINGEARAFADLAPSAQFTLAALVEALGMKPDRVAIELNRDIIPRDRWPKTLLKEGDRLEVVHFVGGGRSSSVTKLSCRSKCDNCVT
jgi:thiamine biosynthesis protein ThiS